MASFILVDAERTSLANTLVTDLATGFIKIYVSNGGLLLATVPLAATIGTVSNGVITLNCAATTCTASGTGNATYATFCNSGGTKLAGGDVSTSEATVNLINTSINSGQTVTITSGSITVPAGT